MFRKIRTTDNPPAEASMIWDGTCAFCEYWINYWQDLSQDEFQFIAYQDLNSQFSDIDKSYFKEAVRFIEPDGHVYNGPDAAYRSLYQLGKFKWLHRSYQKNVFFRNLSDSLYQWIATNRGLCFRISKFLFGSDPHSLKPFWAIYLFVLLYLIFY